VQREELTLLKEREEEKYHINRDSIELIGVSKRSQVIWDYRNNALNLLLQLTAEVFEDMKLLANVQFSDLFG
jgi:hypothetical protein